MNWSGGDKESFDARCGTSSVHMYPRLLCDKGRWVDS
jgi:hypothetical protein